MAPPHHSPRRDVPPAHTSILTAGLASPIVVSGGGRGPGRGGLIADPRQKIWVKKFGLLKSADFYLAGSTLWRYTRVAFAQPSERVPHLAGVVALNTSISVLERKIVMRFPARIALIVSSGALLLLCFSGYRFIAISVAVTNDAAQGTWNSTGDLTIDRDAHTATLLTDGRVVVIGGLRYLHPAPTIVEVYEPSRGTWSISNGRLSGSGHTATLLPNGQVLVAWLSSQFYDRASDNFGGAGFLFEGRISHTATLLTNGKVLVAGGNDQVSELSSAELYDPTVFTWSRTGSMKVPRELHTATLLPNGKVLIAGGYSKDSISGSSELYDPAKGTWEAVGSLNIARRAHTATLLPNGKVLVTGGQSANSNFLNSAEIYDPATGKWTLTGSMNTARQGPSAVSLPSGKVLVLGGGPLPKKNDAEIYDPVSGTWSLTASLNVGRDYATATLLRDGRVLAAGGNGANGTLQSAELYDPAVLNPSGNLASVSAASYSRPVAQESIISAFGVKLATTIQAAGTLPLPTSLAGTTVRVRDSAGIERLAPLFFVSAGQVNYLIPAGTASGMATVTITSGDGSISTGMVQVSGVAPGLFTLNQSGQGLPAALVLRAKADGSQSYESISEPIDLGSPTDQVFLILFGTGIRFRSSLSAAIVTVGGEYAQVSYAGAQPDFAGLDQVNVLIPRSLIGRGEVEVLLTADAQMANPVKINVR